MPDLSERNSDSSMASTIALMFMNASAVSTGGPDPMELGRKRSVTLKSNLRSAARRNRATCPPTAEKLDCMKWPPKTGPVDKVGKSGGTS
jgi:hypothetical protein